jgi:tetratricopeptide (TPR) repeat protein
MPEGYEHVPLAELETNPQKPGRRWELSPRFGIEGANVNVATLDPGERLSQNHYHYHEHQRELFYVARGRCRAETADDRLDLATQPGQGPPPELPQHLDVAPLALAAARAVSGNGPQALSRLLDRSLLSREEGDEGTPRYDIHHLIRQCLAEKLAAAGEAEATAEAHAAFFTRFLERQGTALRGREQKAAWQSLLAERGNVHAAWEWMLARGPAEMVEAALPALFHFYYMRNHFPSAVTLFSAAVPVLESRGQALRRPLGRLLGRLAAVRARMGRFSAAETAAGQALTMARELADRRGEAQALRLLGHVAYEKGQYSNAESLARQSLALFEELEDGHGQANCLNTLGAIAAVRASYSEADETHGWQSQIDTEWLQAAQARLEKALALRQEAGDRWGESIVHHNLGYVTYVYGQHTGEEGYFREAHAQFLEAVTIDRTLDLPGPRRLNWLACTLGMLGDLKQAEQTFLQALTQAAEGHAWREVTDVLGNLARFIYLEDGRVEEACTLLTAVAAHPAADARVRLSAQEHLRARNHPVPPVSDAGPPALARIVDRVLAQ